MVPEGIVRLDGDVDGGPAHPVPQVHLPLGQGCLFPHHLFEGRPGIGLGGEVGLQGLVVGALDGGAAATGVPGLWVDVEGGHGYSIARASAPSSSAVLARITSATSWRPPQWG